MTYLQKLNKYLLICYIAPFITKSSQSALQHKMEGKITAKTYKQ